MPVRCVDMVGEICIRRIVAASVGAVLVCACGAAGPDPVLAVTGFETTSCVDGSGADQCFLLTAEVEGSQPGVGRCDVVAVAGDGTRLFAAETVGPLALEPGRTYEWLVALPAADNPAFDQWMPVCRPRDRG